MSNTNPNVWISRVDPGLVEEACQAVEARLPLAGCTFAVKDNIDVAGLATTAACPAYAYRPQRSAPVVDILVAAGATVVGKTNMDQFATGLTGTRSPYGTCLSVVDPTRISGGSSSGSAVAVAAGLATFALGTDTAGSGRVPAACNGIVGFKPTPGLLPITGIVPACRSLDCPSLFTRTVGEARRLLDILTAWPAAGGGGVPGPDADHRTASSTGAAAPGAPGRHRVAVPQERFLSAMPAAAQAAFHATVDELRHNGTAAVIEVDLTSFFAVGDLLYGGAWVAERYAAVGAFVSANPSRVNPVVASIIGGARDLTAVQAFQDRYRLEELAAETAAIMGDVDVLITPTVAHVPTVTEVMADPVGANTALGRFTTFANLLRFTAVAVPGVARTDAVPSGVTVLSAAGGDRLALEVAAVISGENTMAPAATPPTATPPTATPPTAARPGTGPRTAAPESCVPSSQHRTPAGVDGSGHRGTDPPDTQDHDGDRVAIAVVGAHLEGQPLNHELTDRGARLEQRTTTTACYRLYALATTPAKPGLVRMAGEPAVAAHPADPADGTMAAHGAAIEVEVWSLPPTGFAAFVAAVPAPLTIGKVELRDGARVSGFLCEPIAIQSALNITGWGGWRGYLAAQRAPA